MNRTLLVYSFSHQGCPWESWFDIVVAAAVWTCRRCISRRTITGQKGGTTVGVVLFILSQLVLHHELQYSAFPFYVALLVLTLNEDNCTLPFQQLPLTARVHTEAPDHTTKRPRHLVRTNSHLNAPITRIDTTVNLPVVLWSCHRAEHNIPGLDSWPTIGYYSTSLRMSKTPTSRLLRQLHGSIRKRICKPIIYVIRSSGRKPRTNTAVGITRTFVSSTRYVWLRNSPARLI